MVADLKAPLKLPVRSLERRGVRRQFRRAATWARELIARLDLRGRRAHAGRRLRRRQGDGGIARAVPRGAVTGADASAEMIAFAPKPFHRRKSPI
jgi:hypothetical protein